MFTSTRLVALLALIGYIWNIVKIVEAVGHEFTVLVFFRVIGLVLAPLGAVLGFF